MVVRSFYKFWAYRCPKRLPLGSNGWIAFIDMSQVGDVSPSPWPSTLAFQSTLEWILGKSAESTTRPASWNCQFSCQLNEAIEKINPQWCCTPLESLNSWMDMGSMAHRSFPYDRPSLRSWWSPLQNLIQQGHSNYDYCTSLVADLDAGDIYLKEPLALYGSAEEIFQGRWDNWANDGRIVREEISATPQEGKPLFSRRTSEQINLALCPLRIYHVVWPYPYAWCWGLSHAYLELMACAWSFPCS